MYPTALNEILNGKKLLCHSRLPQEMYGLDCQTAQSSDAVLHSVQHTFYSWSTALNEMSGLFYRSLTSSLCRWDHVALKVSSSQPMGKDSKGWGSCRHHSQMLRRRENAKMVSLSLKMDLLVIGTTSDSEIGDSRKNAVFSAWLWFYLPVRFVLI